MTPLFKANDFVRIIKPAHLIIDHPDQLVPDDSVVGLVGVVRATFNYDTHKPDYDVAIIGRKYRSHHQHVAVEQCFLQPYAEDVNFAA
jgi:hypothetical protein